MSVTRRSVLGGLLLTAAGCSTDSGGAQSANSAIRGPLVIATGSTIGVYYKYGQALASLLRSHATQVDVLPTGASVENIELLTKGRAQLGFVALDAAADAAGGRAPFSAPAPVLALARLYDEYTHLVVLDSSRVRQVADLRGLRVVLGSAASGTAIIASRILSAAGLDPAHDIQPAYLSLADSVSALLQQRIDAFFWSGGLPTSGIATLAASKPIRLVPTPTEATALRGRYGWYYRSGTIPAGTYQGVGSVDTVAIADLLATTAAMDAGTAANITRILFAGRSTIAREVPIADRLDERIAIFTEPIPLHAGALQYYRDTKANG